MIVLRGLWNTTAPFAVSTAVLALTTVLLAGVLIVDVVLKRKRRFSIVTNPLMADEEEC